MHSLPCPSIMLTPILALISYYLALVSPKAPSPLGVLVAHLLDRAVIPAQPPLLILSPA